MSVTKQHSQHNDPDDRRPRTESCSRRR